MTKSVVCESHEWQAWAVASYWTGDNCKLSRPHACATCTAADEWPSCKLERAWIRQCLACKASEYWRATGAEEPDPFVRGWLMLGSTVETLQRDLQFA